MNHNRIIKFLFGGFALVVLILALVFSLISCEPQTMIANDSSATTNMAAPTSPVATDAAVPSETIPPQE